MKKKSISTVSICAVLFGLSSLSFQNLPTVEKIDATQSLTEIGIQDASLHFRPGSLGLNRDIIKKISKTKERVYIRSL